MRKPPYAFRTASHAWLQAEAPGVYRAEPGGALLELSLEEQRAPAHLLDTALWRIIAAWVLARGGDALHLNGERCPVAPEDLDRPPATPPRRVASIAPSNAELLWALGAADRLVGVDESADFPPAVAGLPRLGPDLAVDAAALAALQPDVVLASLSVPAMERNIAELDRLGVPMLVTAPRSLPAIHADLRRIGAALGAPAAAEAAVEAMEARCDALRNSRPARPVRFYLEWWPNPMISPGAACWSNEMVALAGGRNVFADLPGASGPVTADALVAADPEVIGVAWCGVPFERLNVQRVLQRPALAGVSAIRSGRVHALDESLLGRPGPRVVEGAAALRRVLHAP